MDLNRVVQTYDLFEKWIKLSPDTLFLYDFAAEAIVIALGKYT